MGHIGQYSVQRFVQNSNDAQLRMFSKNPNNILYTIIIHNIYYNICLMTNVVPIDLNLSRHYLLQFTDVTLYSS